MFTTTRRQFNTSACRMYHVFCRPRFSPAFDPYTYTHGRWLDRDQEQREAREIKFNFDALLDFAIACSPGAHQVLDCEKKEGGFNRGFLIHLDNGKTVVARLPSRLAGPPGITTSSEVATLKLVNERTKVPVPNVLSWSSDSNGPVGSEYMIQDAVPGVLLKDVWNTMTAVQHIECISSIGALVKELCQLNFPCYGSLYLSENAPPGSVPFDDGRFSIGPLCAPHHWGCELSSPRGPKFVSGSQGPWHILEEYFSSSIAQAKAPRPFRRRPPSDFGHVEDHAEIIITAQKTLDLLASVDSIRKAAQPILFHPDFHTRNIFQSASIEPACVFAAEIPDFAQELPFDEILDKEENAKANENSAAARLKSDVDFCAQTWAVVLQVCPKYREASRLPQPLLSFLASGSNGWLKNTLTVQSLLYDLKEIWDELGLPGQSLYLPSKNQVNMLQQQRDRLRDTERLKEYLARLLHCDTDGWVAGNRWEDVLPRYREQYRRLLASYAEGEQDEYSKRMAIAEAENVWPFDLR